METEPHTYDDETAKLILFSLAMCAMERCLAAGLVHQDADSRNSVTLQVRIMDIDMPRYCADKPGYIDEYGYILRDIAVTKSRHAGFLGVGLNNECSRRAPLRCVFIPPGATSLFLLGEEGNN